MDNCTNHTSLDDGNEDTVLEMGLSGLINAVFLPAVCVFGVVGNLLNLAILTRRKLQKSFRSLEQAANLCLIALALSDLLFCISAFLTLFLPSNGIYSDSGFLLFYGQYNVAIINVFIMESTFLTVTMSLERYLAICFPLRQNIYLTTNRLKYVIVFTFIFSIFFNIPSLWRNKMILICDNRSNDQFEVLNLTLRNITSLVGVLNPVGNSRILLDIGAGIPEPNNTQIIDGVVNLRPLNSNTTILHKNSTELSLALSSISLTPLSAVHSVDRPSSLSSQSSSTLSATSASSSVKISSLKTENQRQYTTKIGLLNGSHAVDTTYRTAWAVLGNFLPLVLLLYFNVRLCRKIYRSYKLRKQIGRQNRNRSPSHFMTITLVAIVALFFILVAPSEVTLKISHMTISGDTPLYKNIEAVLNLMQSINFSVNFILYCIISPHFRKTLKHMILCGCCYFQKTSRKWATNSKSSFM